MVMPSFLLHSAILVLVLCMTTGSGVLAQNMTSFSTFIADLNQLGFGNFTAWVHEVGADSESSSFYQSISGINPYTLFIPNNDAFVNPSANFLPGTYLANDLTFFLELLEYHLVPGAWAQADLGTGSNYTILPTILQANPPTLENLQPQQIACGSTSNGFEFYNQRVTTTVQSSFTLGPHTINVINNFLAFPPTYDIIAKDDVLNQFEALRLTVNDRLDIDMGFTAFVPTDDAFAAAKSALAGANQTDVYYNHIISAETAYTSLFGAASYKAASGLVYSFSGGSQGYTVTVNGTTANIVQPNILTTNGVVHLIDQVLVSAPAANPSVGTSDAPVSTATASVTGAPESSASASATESIDTISSTGLSVSRATQSSHAVGPGTVVGIVAIALLLLSLPIVVLYLRVLRRRRRSRRGAAERGYRSSLFGLPSPALRPTPFYVNAPGVDRTSSDTLRSDVRHPPLMDESAPSVSLPPEAKVAPEKVNDNLVEDHLRALSGSTEVVAPPSLVIPPHVVDHIVQQIAQRIDRSPVALPETVPEQDAPPSYSSPPRLDLVLSELDMNIPRDFLTRTSRAPPA